jgi:hypothetical protein
MIYTKLNLTYYAQKFKRINPSWAILSHKRDMARLGITICGSNASAGVRIMLVKLPMRILHRSFNPGGGAGRAPLPKQCQAAPELRLRL